MYVCMYLSLSLPIHSNRSQQTNVLNLLNYPPKTSPNSAPVHLFTSSQVRRMLPSISCSFRARSSSTSNSSWGTFNGAETWPFSSHILREEEFKNWMWHIHWPQKNKEQPAFQLESTYVFLCFLLFLSFCLSVSPYLCLSIHPSIHPSVHPSIHPSIHPSS